MREMITSTRLMDNFSSKEEMPRRQDKPLKKPHKAIKEDIEDKRRIQAHK
jgi:hypothetical protein